MAVTGRRVLLTGATGFIGSHVAEALVKRGHRVRVLVRTNALQSIGRLADVASDVRSEIEIVWGDVRDPDAVEEAARGVEAIVHLASLISIPFSYRRPVETVEVNVLGTLHVARAALRAGVSLFVHTSTSEVYGTAQRIPMAEDHPRRAQSPYAASKIGADFLVESFHLSFGLPAVILRPFNTYGPRQTARAVIPLVLSQLLVSDRVRLGSTEPKRDFTFVEDTAEAFALLVEALRPPFGATLHLGTGRAVSIGEMVEIARRVVGRDIPVERGAPERVRPVESEVMHLEADPSAFRSLTGWTPRVSLEEGLRRTAAWLRARPEECREALRAL